MKTFEWFLFDPKYKLYCKFYFFVYKYVLQPFITGIYQLPEVTNSYITHDSVGFCLNKQLSKLLNKHYNHHWDNKIKICFKHFSFRSYKIVYNVDFPAHISLSKRIVVNYIRPGGVGRNFQSTSFTLLTSCY